MLVAYSLQLFEMCSNKFGKDPEGEDDCGSLIDREDEPPPLIERNDSWSDSSSDDGGSRNFRSVVITTRPEEARQGMVQFPHDEVQQGTRPEEARSLQFLRDEVQRGVVSSNGIVQGSYDIPTSSLERFYFFSARYVARYVARIDDTN